MAKRKEALPRIDSTDGTGGIDKPTALEGGIERPDTSLDRIEAPELVPPQRELRADEKPATDPAPPGIPPLEMARLGPPAPAAGDVETVSFAEAATRAAGSRLEPRRKRAAIAAYLRTRRLLPLAAMIALAAAVGVITGSLATTGLTSLTASDPGAHAAMPNDSRLLKEAITQLGIDIAGLKSHIEHSAKTVGVQFARLSERLDRADRAQAESSGKLARLSESIDRRNVAAAAAASDPVTTGSVGANRPPQLQAPATLPAGQPIVEGWTLRTVYNGSAVIQGRIGLVEVEPGDTLPGLGRIETIRRQDGRWVVVTSRGLIIAR